MARHALVVGLSQYAYIRSLEQPPIDAEKVAQILEQHGEYTVTRLPQCWNEATQNYEIDPQQPVNDVDLALALKKLLIELPENGATIEGLVYFAGHGFTFSSNMGMEKGAIATSNTKITMKDEQVIDYEKAVSFSDLNDVIQKSNLQSLVFILDCCHSGYFIEKEMTKKSLYSAFIDDHRNYYCISACQTREKSTVLMGNEHSIFSTAVINGLDASQANQQGKITGDRLYDYIQSELTVKGPKFGQTAIKMGWGEAINIVSYPQVKSINVIATIFNPDNPYLGLYAFQAKDEPYFHGRKRAIQSLISRLDRNRFLAVIGSSGCGKSSLIKAGLLPELQRDRVVGSKDWQIEIMTPGDRPLDTLLEKLEHLQKYQNTLLFIDQCEEIFTLCKDVQERQRFFQLIAQEASVPQRLARVLVGIRGDFLDQCAEFPAVAKLINRVQPTTYCVEGLALEELQLAIEEPARLHGVNLEAGLAGAIAHDVINQPGVLPLLQYALKELWEVCVQEKGENLLTWSGYQKIDGVAGALSRRANNIYSSLTESEQKLVQQLFLELAEIGDGNTVTKRSVLKESLVNEHPQLPKIIDDLTKHRLIAVTERKDAAGEYQVYIDLAHESLFEKWDLLKSWIESDRHNLRLKRKFQNDCQDWLNKYAHSTDALLTGAWLGTVAEWITTYQPQLSSIQQTFFDLSIQHRDQEKQEKEEKQRQLLEIAEEKARAIAGQLTAIEGQLQAESEKVEEQKAKIRVQRQRGIIATVLGSVISILTIYNWQSSLISDAKTWVKLAENDYDNGQQLEAMMASVKALNYLKWVVLNKDQYLEEIKSIVINIKEVNRWKIQGEAIKSLAVSPRDSTIAVGTDKGNLYIYSSEGQLQYKFPDKFSSNIGSIISLAFTTKDFPKSELLAVVGNKTLQIFQHKNNRLKLIKTMETSARDVRFSNNPNNLIGLALNKEEIIKLFAMRDRLEVVPSSIKFPQLSNANKENSQESYIASLDFNPNVNYKMIAFRDWSKKVTFWNYQTNKITKPLPQEHKYGKGIVRFTYDGQYLASAGYDDKLIIWQWQNSQWEKIAEIFDSDNQIYSLSFSPDNKFIAIGGKNEKIKIWNMQKLLVNPQQRADYILSGHDAFITGLEFNQEGKLVSVSEDYTVRIWQYKPNPIIDDPNFSKYKQLLNYTCSFLSPSLKLNQNIPNWFDKNKLCFLPSEKYF